MKIGILDWGIGGVGILQKIRQNTDADILYFSDSGYIPYGKVEENELRQRVEKVINYLKLQECKLIVVACNAASTVLPVDDSVIGMIEPAIKMMEELKLESIGIAGGKRTVESNIFKTRLSAAGKNVIQQIAQPLSARIESGDLSSDELKTDIQKIFGSFGDVKDILLACTHYPLIAGQISNLFPDLRLIDPSDKVCEEVLICVNDRGGGAIKWVTSGNICEMLNVLKDVYKIDARRIERNNL